MENVKFVRIRGRIVPIRSKKKKKQNKGTQAAGLLSAGLATIGASFVAGNKVKKADILHQQAFDFAMDEPFSKLHKNSKSAAHQMEKAGKSLKRAGRVKQFSRLGGAALIGMGVERLSEKYGLDNNLGTEFASEFAGVGSALGSEALFKKGFGVGFRKQIKAKKFKVPSGISNPIKGLSKDLISKFVKKQLRFKF